MLMNYVSLEEGKPVRMHFSDHYTVQREIFDRELNRSKNVTSEVFWVDLIDGFPAARTLSILSQKLWAQLSPFLPDKRFMEYEFLITKEGSGFQTDYRVQPIRVSDARLAEIAVNRASLGTSQ